MKRLKPILFPRRRPTRKSLLRIYNLLRKHYGPRDWWPGETRFEVIVGTILTQNAAWKNVEKAIDNLKIKNMLKIERLSKLSVVQLAKLIRASGFFNVKAKRLIALLRFIRERYGSDLRKMFLQRTDTLRKELLEVNGVGEETADSILLYAGEKPSFVVDAYTRRVFRRHRYIKGDEDYSALQEMFSKLLPRSVKLFNDYHAQIVQVGKDYCRTVARCLSCPLRPLL